MLHLFLIVIYFIFSLCKAGQRPHTKWGGRKAERVFTWGRDWVGEDVRAGWAAQVSPRVTTDRLLGAKEKHLQIRSLMGQSQSGAAPLPPGFAGTKV